MIRAFRFSMRIRRLLSWCTLLGITLSMLPATMIPVQAAPALILTQVDVAAPQINCIFDTDCTITVSDLADHFTPPAAVGEGFLQSRRWPQGEAGTPGEGLYPYLYRIDLREATAATAVACVTQLRIDFGEVARLDYNGDGAAEDAFVITAGGLGNVKPVAIEQVGPTLIFHFGESPICPGSEPGNGDSSFFFGLASRQPYREVVANVTGTLGLAESLDAWSPAEAQRLDIRILESTNKSFHSQFQLPSPTLVQVSGPEGKLLTQLLLPAVEPNSHTPGFPDVPVVRQLLAVPRGAEARVANVKVGGVEQMHDILLYPSQPVPADLRRQQEEGGAPPGAFEDLPFVLNEEAYASDQPYPPQVVEVLPLGRMRDLDLVQVSVAGGQYNAAKKTLDLFDSVEFEVQFAGGEEGFLPREQAENPFDTSFDALYLQAINAAAIQHYRFGGIVGRICIGHEFLIITPTELRPAADALRDFKVGRGLSTAVYEMGNNPGQAGSTKEEIQEFIRHRYDTCKVRPAYLLLLGDAELIPTFYRSTLFGDSGGSDLDYSLMNAGDIMPDLAYGRIPVDTLEDAQRVIDKIMAYEGTPPFAPSFYQDMSFAAYFQCCRPDVAQDGTASRSFIETAEFVRDEMESQGYDVERIYTTSTAYHSNPTKESYYNSSTRSTTPDRYYNGTLLPADLRASSGYPWDGDTADVVDAINDGRFLVLHRDHGFTNGWGDPEFYTGDLGSLSNGSLTPVVYSINCASGMFDNETLNPALQAYGYSSAAGYISWAEELLRMEGGAVGIIGDTRVSPTWANSALTRGLFDATWPGVLPLEGGATPIRRLGDILNYGKVYMVSQVGVAQTAGSVSSSQTNTNLALYHVLGDPSMKMWTASPWKIFLPKYYYEIEIPKPGEWWVRYPVEGAMLTALQDGNPIARAPVVNGQAMLNFIQESAPDMAIQLSVQHPDGVATPLEMPDSQGRITPGQGGVVQHEPSHFALHFGPDAVPQATDILYQLLDGPSEPMTDDLTSLLTFELNAFTAGEDGAPQPVIQFASPYSMVIGYADYAPNTADAGEMVAGERAVAAQADMAFGVYSLDTNDGEWKPLACSADDAAQQITCTADHFSEFALVAEPDTTTQEGDTLFLPSLSSNP